MPAPRKYLVLLTLGAVNSCVQLGVTGVPHRAPEGVADALRKGRKCSEFVGRAGRPSCWQPCREGGSLPLRVRQQRGRARGSRAGGDLPLPNGGGQEKEADEAAALSKESAAIFLTDPDLGGGRLPSPAAAWQF